ncbi:unnamed protein product [Paramecium pentaurelia]|uniref:Uncharacterized protein n=1 Tax=Paramecium pentaurelia TaxID=43138 RepID=A0A8S1RZZ1_9CILI|nr:unnamed protein product [Paramecium pentaurelia]
MNSILKLRYLVKLDFTLKNLKNFIKLIRFIIYQNFQITHNKIKIQLNKTIIYIDTLFQDSDIYKELLFREYSLNSICSKFLYSLKHKRNIITFRIYRKQRL